MADSVSWDEWVSEWVSLSITQLLEKYTTHRISEYVWMHAFGAEFRFLSRIQQNFSFLEEYFINLYNRLQ